MDCEGLSSLSYVEVLVSSVSFLKKSGSAF